jgi:hypothetical protein
VIRFDHGYAASRAETRKNYLNVGSDFLRLLIQRQKVMSKAQAATTAKPVTRRRMYRGIVTADGEAGRY